MASIASISEVSESRRAFIPESESLGRILEVVDLMFGYIPREIRYDRLIVRGPCGEEKPNHIYIETRKMPSFFEHGECRIPAHRIVAQILEVARSQPVDLSMIRLVVPYGEPNGLTLWIKR